MIGLVSLICLDSKPWLQPNEEKQEILDRIAWKMVWKIRLAIFGAIIFVAGATTIPFWLPKLIG